MNGVRAGALLIGHAEHVEHNKYADPHRSEVLV